MLFTIGNSYESLTPGNYPASFVGVSKIETKKGEALRWEFHTDDGKTISGLTDAAKPTVKNKLGRWLCALSNARLQPGTEVDPTQYVGRKYILIVSPHESGGRLDTFSLLN